MTSLLTGLDLLLQEKKRLAYLREKKVALLVNPTSVDRNLNHMIDLLVAEGIDIVKLFGPEHGVRSEAQDMEAVEESRDPITSIPTKSLYGATFESLRPSSDDLDGIDLLIADIQDIGSRYYTYAYTIGLTMEACGRAGVEVWVVDRPNPIRGDKVEGGILEPSLYSFVGMQPLPTRPGMTIGELCNFFNLFTNWKCELTILKMKGWQRSMWFDQTGLPWVMPSPNMPTLDTAICYPGQCLLEGTEMSEGRGTTRPFEYFGAPYVDAYRLKERLESYALPGVQFRPISFRPMFQKYALTTCQGLQVHVTNRDEFDSISMSYAIIQSMIHLYPDTFKWREKAYEFVEDELAIDLLLGKKELRIGLQEEVPLPELLQLWETPEKEEFLERRERALLY